MAATVTEGFCYLTYVTNLLDDITRVGNLLVGYRLGCLKKICPRIPPCAVQLCFSNVLSYCTVRLYCPKVHPYCTFLLYFPTARMCCPPLLLCFTVLSYCTVLYCIVLLYCHTWPRGETSSYPAIRPTAYVEMLISNDLCKFALHLLVKPN